LAAVALASTAATGTSQYSVRTDYQDSLFKIYVRDGKTGQDIRLGDDGENATYYTMSDKYVIWGRGCIQETCSSKNGLYAYVLAAGKQIFVASEGEFAKVDGDWVVYADVSNMKHIDVGEGSSTGISIHAHNLLTSEDIILDPNLVVTGLNLIRGYYACSNGLIAWLAFDPGTQTHSLQIYDTNSREKRKLGISLKSPRSLSLSQSAVIWQDEHAWKGYDLKHGMPFTPSLVPPGWDQVPIGGILETTVQGEQLSWIVEVQGKFYHFNATLVSNDQSSSPVQKAIPTPEIVTMPEMISTPVPATVPTSYP